MPPGWLRSARLRAPSVATSFRPGCCISSPASSATTWRWWCATPASPRRTSWSARGCPTIRSKPIAPATLLRSGYRAFQRQAKISDELGMFLPGVGRGSIALFLERSKGWFTAAEKERARRTYPAIAGLYRAHIGHIFAALGTGPGAPSPQVTRATLLVDRDGERVFANKEWRAAEADPAVGRAIAALANDKSGQVRLSDNRMLHVAPLEPDFPPAPAGRIYVIERIGLAPAALSPRAVIAQ